MSEDKTRPGTRDGRSAPVQGAVVLEIPIGDLMPGSREAVILYKGERYRLRITSKDKLILTK